MLALVVLELRDEAEWQAFAWLTARAAAGNERTKRRSQSAGAHGMRVTRVARLLREVAGRAAGGGMCPPLIRPCCLWFGVERNKIFALERMLPCRKRKRGSVLPNGMALVFKVENISANARTASGPRKWSTEDEFVSIDGNVRMSG